MMKSNAQNLTWLHKEGEAGYAFPSLGLSEDY
jgi:hypothetical protein